MTKERFNMLVGSIGAFIGVFVFLAYIPQIIANLHGQPSQPWQPLYGWTKSPKRDYILIVPNLAGVILGTLTFLTSF